MSSQSKPTGSRWTSLTLSLMGLGVGGAGLALVAASVSVLALTLSNLVFALLAIVGFALAGLMAGALLGGLTIVRLGSGLTPAQLARWFWQGGRALPAPAESPAAIAGAHPTLVNRDAVSGDDFCQILGDTWGWSQPVPPPDDQP
jgi:hypothetical protein